MKIVARHCERTGCMDSDLVDAAKIGLPFDLTLLPTDFPPLSDLKLWVYPEK